jgi:hypothetical protein
VAQQHSMIQLFVNEPDQLGLHVAEVYEHAPGVKRFAGQLDFQNPVVPVRVPAFSPVVHQPMAITKGQSLDDGMHEHQSN